MVDRSSPNTSDNQPNYLTGVSCSSSVSAPAVGVDVVDGLADQSLIESWNGSVWSIVPSPEHLEHPEQQPERRIVQRPLSLHGRRLVQSLRPERFLHRVDPDRVVEWLVWSIVPSPNPSPTQRNSLRAVSCTGPSACTAVGSLAPASYAVTAQPLIESSRSIPNGRAPVITSGAHTVFTAGSSGTFTVTSRGRPLAFVSESGALPNGVSFIDNGDGTATLSGVPVAGSAGTYPLVIAASNSVSPAATQNFTLTVENPPTTSILIPSNGATLSGVDLPRRLRIERLQRRVPALRRLLRLQRPGDLHGHVDHLRLAVRLEHHHGSQRDATLGVRGHQLELALARRRQHHGGEPDHERSHPLQRGDAVGATTSTPPPRTPPASSSCSSAAPTATTPRCLHGHLDVYGWLCGWNTTTVPNGSYILVSLATNSTGGAGAAASASQSTTRRCLPSRACSRTPLSRKADAEAFGRAVFVGLVLQGCVL